MRRLNLQQPLRHTFFLFGLLLGGMLLPSLSWGQGFLIPTQRNLSPLAIKYHRVQVNIQDRAARTTVTQVFKNHTNRVLEATYIFPVPKGATVSNFVLYINGKPKRGKVLVKERARSIYLSIVRRMQDPGLLEYMGGRLFRARVYPIPRNGEQRITISFTQMVPYASGMHRFVYPLKTRHKVQTTLKDFTMSVKLKSKTPLKSIYSPTHKVSLARKGDNLAIVGFERSKARLDRDFVLYYAVSPKDLGLNMLSYRTEQKDGYFLMMLTPKVSHSSREIAGKNITFVLDTSGSMSGKKMKWAKRALQICLKKLNPKDHFNVIRFSTDVEAMHRAMKPASPKNIKKAVAFVQRMEAAGGTAIDEALKLALQQKPKGDGVSLVVFLTDGHPTIGETTPSAIVKNSKINNRYKARLFTFGIGTEINTNLLDKMAQLSGGTGDYVKPNKEIKQRISNFYDKVRYPVLSNIKLSVGKGIRLYDMYPKSIPDLFRGGQITLFGRYRGKGAVAISLNGKVGGKNKRYVFETKFPQTSNDHSFVSRLWANRKVAYLLDHIRLKGMNSELKAEVIRLSKKFGIVTPYTSYLVVEDKDEWRLRQPITKRPMIQNRRWTRTWRRRRFRRRPRLWAMPRGGAERSQGRTWDNAPSREPESSPRPTARYAPAKRSAAPPMASGDSSTLKDLTRNSGRQAVKNSKYLKKMKREEVMKGSSHTRFVQGKLFVWTRGGWVDRRYKTSMKVLHVKYMSSLYLKILKMKPTLNRFFALGRSVTIVVGTNKAIVISGSKESKISTSKLRRFLQ
ncbi:MAG: VWA domain-containing protein [Deltaproteobacteria bacterium]|nr:MAG: VWA domain-containing protein [Deltaproteobacteria bacterium]